MSLATTGSALPVDQHLTRSALSVSAYAALKCMILDQQIAPGSVVSIDGLSERLGVSQTPIREALARLEGDGLIARKANGRNYAAALLENPAFEHLYDLRLLLEPEAAALAADSRDAKYVGALRKCLAAMNPSAARERPADYAVFVAADAEFHETIAQIGGNPFLFDAIRHMHSHHRLAFLYRNRGVTDWRAARHEHETIVCAIDDGDTRQARDMMHAHITRSRNVLRQWFTEFSYCGGSGHQPSELEDRA